MKPGDLVELKPGARGLEAPDNVGIYLERVKEKKTFRVVVYTTKGRLELRQEQVRRVLLESRTRESASWTDEELRARLKDLAGQFQSAGEFRAEVTDRLLWEALEDASIPRTVDEMAQALHPVVTPQVRQRVQEALQACADPGVGYFAPAGGGRWAGLSPEAVKRVRRDIEGFQRLRNRLVTTVEEEIEGRLRTRLVGVPLQEARLEPEDRERLARVQAWLRGFVAQDRWVVEQGLAGEGVVALDGFSLPTYLRFLATDWLPPTTATVGGRALLFLLRSGAVGLDEAANLVLERLARLSGFFSLDYEEGALREAARLPGTLSADEIGRREDFRALETYTIDPPDARDFDDAISVETTPDGWRLYVHIADVTHYVLPDSALDRAAVRRGTSVYLPTGVLPMLPARLSEDLCSLRSGSPRPALTAVLDVNREGRIGTTRFCESVILVRENLAYEQVEAWINEGREPFRTLHEVASAMERQRAGLDLETQELRVRLTPDEVQFVLKKGTPATRMIERFMVAANEAVAAHLTAAGVPVAYRCHPLPSKEGVRRLNGQLATMGLDIRITLPEIPEEEQEKVTVLDLLKSGKLELVLGGFAPEAPPPEADEGAPPVQAPLVKGLAQLPPELRQAFIGAFRDAVERLAKLDDPRVELVATYKLLSAVGRALYTGRNIGHFGLGSTCYCHFTSPIRRYPDVLVHRALRWVLQGKPDPAPVPPVLDEPCALATDQGFAADRFERTMVGVAMAFDTLRSASGPVDAVVSSLTKGSAFLLLPTGVEARLLASELAGGPWDVDEYESAWVRGGLPGDEEALELVESGRWRETLDSRATVGLRLGQKVTVEIVDRDLCEGVIRVRPPQPPPTV